MPAMGVKNTIKIGSGDSEISTDKKCGKRFIIIEDM